jgi:hypothetical protein
MIAFEVEEFAPSNVSVWNCSEVVWNQVGTDGDTDVSTVKL